jgi:hypothetical protein
MQAHNHHNMGYSIVDAAFYLLSLALLYVAHFFNPVFLQSISYFCAIVVSMLNAFFLIRKNRRK